MEHIGGRNNQKCEIFVAFLVSPLNILINNALCSAAKMRFFVRHRLQPFDFGHIFGGFGGGVLAVFGVNEKLDSACVVFHHLSTAKVNGSGNLFLSGGIVAKKVVNHSGGGFPHTGSVGGFGVGYLVGKVGKLFCLAVFYLVKIRGVWQSRFAVDGFLGHVYIILNHKRQRCIVVVFFVNLFDTFVVAFVV